MEVDADTSVLSQRPSNSGLQVTLHPLALLNMSDHHTRVRMQYPDEQRHVIGALYGTQNGRDISVHTTYELLCKEETVEGQSDTCTIVDPAYYVTKAEQMKTVFPEYDVLGWYSVSSAPLSNTDMQLHQTMQSYNENPLYLRLDPTGVGHSSVVGMLPVKIYDTERDLLPDGEWQQRFASVAFNLETGEAERIAVDHVAKVRSQHEQAGDVADVHESAVVGQLSNQIGAVQMLRNRVGLLRDYAAAVKAGELPEDPAVLRELAAICHQMPVVTSGDEWTVAYRREAEDATLVAQLSTMTKALQQVQQLVAHHKDLISNDSSSGNPRQELHF